MRLRRTRPEIPAQQMDDHYAQALEHDAGLHEREAAKAQQEHEQRIQEAAEAAKVRQLLEPINTALTNISRKEPITTETLAQVEKTALPPNMLFAVMEIVLTKHQTAYDNDDSSQADYLYTLYGLIGRSDPVTTEHKLNIAQMIATDTRQDNDNLSRIATYKSQLEGQLQQLSGVALSTDRRVTTKMALQAKQDAERIREELKTVEKDRATIERKIHSQIFLASGCVKAVVQQRSASQPAQHVKTPKVNVENVVDEAGNHHTMLVPENRNRITTRALATAGLAGTVLMTGSGSAAAAAPTYPYASSAATNFTAGDSERQIVVSKGSRKETVEMVQVESADGTPELIPVSHAVEVQNAGTQQDAAPAPSPAPVPDDKPTVEVVPTEYRPSPAPVAAVPAQMVVETEAAYKPTVEVVPTEYRPSPAPITAEVVAAPAVYNTNDTTVSEKVAVARQHGSAESLAAAYMEEAQAAGYDSVKRLDPDMQLYQQVSRYIRSQIDASKSLNLTEKQVFMLNEAAARAATISKYPQTAATVGHLPTEGLSEEFITINSQLLMNDVNLHGYNSGPQGAVYTEEQLAAVLRATSIVGALTIPKETQEKQVGTAKTDVSSLEVVSYTNPDRYSMRTEETLPIEEVAGGVSAAPAEVVKSSEQAAREQFAAFLAAIKQKESNNNFTVVNNDTTQRAAGAFQITTATWDGYKGYATADQAPPHIQYERAHMIFTAYAKKFNGDWKDMSMAWYAGPAFRDRGFNIHRRQVHKGKTYPSISDYGDHVLEYMNGFLSNPDSIPGVPGMPQEISNPAVAARNAAQAAQQPAPAPQETSKAEAPQGDYSLEALIQSGRLIDLGDHHTGYDKGNGFKLQLYAVAGVVSEGGESTPGSKYYIEGANGQLIVSAKIAAGTVKLVDHAKTKGIELRAISSFRTMEHQKDLDRNDPGGLVAQPGYSNHQDGTAIDWLLGDLKKFPISKKAYSGINGGKPKKHNIAAAPDSPVWRYLNEYAGPIGGLEQLWFEPWHYSENGG